MSKRTTSSAAAGPAKTVGPAKTGGGKPSSPASPSVPLSQLSEKPRGGSATATSSAADPLQQQQDGHNGSDGTNSTGVAEGHHHHSRAFVLGVVPYNRGVRWLVWVVAFVLASVAIGYSAQNAFRIRTYAIKEYGRVIHEFDPWFNFRATQYLSKNGWDKFFHWFDYMSWYPLGRPVGTTIYPGLQITSVAIHRTLKWLGKGWAMSLNDVCCFVPCWFGAAATVFLALLTYEVSGSWVSAAISAPIFAIIPAHIMRSVGGGFDNESIAMTAMLMTFYFWVRCVRDDRSWPIAIVAGLAYGYMVAAWGGFVFVLNMVAVHATLCAIVDFLRNRFSIGLYRSYTIFFVIGTSIAVCVPPVGWMPFKSMEQLPAFAVFIVLQVLYLAETPRRLHNYPVLSFQAIGVRLKYLMFAFAAVALVAAILFPTGFFGPLSSRVRGLFVKHTRTGNPLVDSVAEHQPASEDAYKHYLQNAYYGWTYGMFLIPFLCLRRVNGWLFLTGYAVAAYYFANKMARLILLSGPVATAMTAIILGSVVDWCIAQVLIKRKVVGCDPEDAVEQLEQHGSDDHHGHSHAHGHEHSHGGAKGGGGSKKPSSSAAPADGGVRAALFHVKRGLLMIYDGLWPLRMIVAVGILFYASQHWQKYWKEFNDHAEQMAHSFSNPQIMFKSRLNNGKTVIIDDYREAYFWLRKNTPEDSRVMAWWDYGYQITGIANRTSIADGNTWNHEHIATLGKCLTSPVKEAHSLIRHLADYVLVWAGGGGDDLAKSPHMARIGNSVYRDICPKDPLCRHFGFYSQGYDQPTPMMSKSLLYHLHAHNHRPGVRLDKKLFEEVFNSKYGLVRIYKVMNVSQESKAWVADPKNRICDAPGSWYCVGQYPPAPEIQSLIKRRRPFGQYENFNKKDAVDDDYYREYMKSSGHDE